MKKLERVEKEANAVSVGYIIPIECALGIKRLAKKMGMTQSKFIEYLYDSYIMGDARSRTDIFEKKCERIKKVLDAEIGDILI